MNAFIPLRKDTLDGVTLCTSLVTSLLKGLLLLIHYDTPSTGTDPLTES